MTQTDAAYLLYVTAAFVVFAIVLAWATHRAPGRH
jgi:hypothetical protein